jgi:uncharacterized protein (TIGR02118 family)
MIKVSILYPAGEGSTFDMEYYRTKHMPMAQELMSPAMLGFAVDEGIAGGLPGSAAPYAAIGHLLFESLEAFQSAFGPHARTLVDDIPNYTNVQPAVQISRVVV